MDFSIKDHRLHRDGAQVNFVPTKNKGGIIKPRYIVLHDTASPLSDAGDIDWLARSSPNSSAHFVVSREGKVTQLAPTNVKTWHAGRSKWKGLSNMNDYAIGIEIDNPGALSRIADGIYAGGATRIMGELASEVEQKATHAHGSAYWLHYTRAQIEVVAGMCRAIAAKYPIEEILTHWLISPGRKIDTNPLFPLEQVRELVFGNRDPQPITHPPVAPAPPAIIADATVTASGLNLRDAPVSGEKLAVLPRGTRLDVQQASRVNGWLYVVVANGEHAGKTGFIAARFVDQD